MKTNLKITITFLLILCSLGLHATEKVALVIGNNNYSQAPLKNPVMMHGQLARY